MGSGSSRSRVKRFDRGTQMLINSEPVLPRSALPPKSPLFKPVPPKPIDRKGRPIGDTFQLYSNIEDYSSIWDHDIKLSSTFEQSVRSDRTTIKHHQKETLNNKQSKKTSTTLDSARIESINDTETHSCINLSSSEKVDELIKNLNNIHKQLDEIIKRRTEQISIETESVLSHILNETQDKQQRLLNYAKDQQLKTDEHYRQLLQDYIFQLDQLKAKDLIDLQNQLQIYRDQISDESQIKIITVNEQANITKSKIVKEEQQKAAGNIDLITLQLQQISNDDKFVHLGSESITKTYITTNSNVGTKASGQNCNFKFDQNDSISKHNNTREVEEEQKVTRRVSVTQKSKIQQ